MTGRAPHARTNDQGGVWILTGIVLAVLMYGFVVLLDVAGFTAVLPLVILPPVVLGLIGANNLIGGGRTHGRPASGPAPAAAPTAEPGVAAGGHDDVLAAPFGPIGAEEQPPSQ